MSPKTPKTRKTVTPKKTRRVGPARSATQAARRVLDRMLQILRRPGNWTKGTLHERIGRKDKFCLLGARDEAVKRLGSRHLDGFLDEGSKISEMALNLAINGTNPASAAVIPYNDAHDRTHEEVVATLRRAKALVGKVVPTTMPFQVGQRAVVVRGGACGSFFKKGEVIVITKTQYTGHVHGRLESPRPGYAGKENYVMFSDLRPADPA